MKISTTQGVVIQEAIQCSEFLSKTKPSCSWDFDFTFKSTLTLEVKDVDTQSTNYENHLLSGSYTRPKFKQKPQQLKTN